MPVGNNTIKKTAHYVLTQSRELTNYCQESVRPTHSRRYAKALSNIEQSESMNLLVQAIKNNEEASPIRSFNKNGDCQINTGEPYSEVLKYIENLFQSI